MNRYSNLNWFAQQLWKQVIIFGHPKNLRPWNKIIVDWYNNQQMRTKKGKGAPREYIDTFLCLKSNLLCVIRVKQELKWILNISIATIILGFPLQVISVGFTFVLTSCLCKLLRLQMDSVLSEQLVLSQWQVTTLMRRIRLVRLKMTRVECVKSLSSQTVSYKLN